jgi:hypothetical protein
MTRKITPDRHWAVTLCPPVRRPGRAIPSFPSWFMRTECDRHGKVSSRRSCWKALVASRSISTASEAARAPRPNVASGPKKAKRQGQGCAWSSPSYSCSFPPDFSIPHQHGKPSDASAARATTDAHRPRPPTFAVCYCDFGGAAGSTAATPSELMLKVRKVNRSEFAYWCTRPNDS